jgi:very-short-patch-repair endonuclease
LKFRRQHNIEKYIVDFYCEKINLIIEIDGDVHGYANKIQEDKTREEFLKNKGFNIIRYANNEIYNNLENVMEDLWIKCEKLKDDN